MIIRTKLTVRSIVIVEARNAGHLALGGLLAGYTGLTREATATGSPDAPEPA